MGLVVPDLVHAFWAEVAKSLSRALADKSYGLLISCSDEDAMLEQREIDQMLARRVDALMIASAQWSVESFRQIEQHGTPYLLLDRHFAGLRANLIDFDNEGVGFAATTHLIERGCRRIAHIRGPEFSSSIGRLDGFKQALAENGLPQVRCFIAAAASADAGAESSGYQAMEQLLHCSSKPDGVFCFNDTMAVGAMKAILQAGLRIPEDIALIGCGNTPNADIFKVALSTIDHNPAMVGEQAAKLAFSLIDAKERTTPQTIQVPYRLISRASTAR
jgi:LacI family transcriptional regulator